MRIYTEQWVELRVLLGELRVQWGFHLSAVGRQTTTSALKWDPALNREYEEAVPNFVRYRTQPGHMAVSRIEASLDSAGGEFT